MKIPSCDRKKSVLHVQDVYTESDTNEDYDSRIDIFSDIEFETLKDIFQTQNFNLNFNFNF